MDLIRPRSALVADGMRRKSAFNHLIGANVLRSDLSLYSDFAITTGVGAGVGQAGFSLPIPNQPALIGYLADVQWAVLDQGSPSPFGFTLSSAAKLVLF